MTLPRDTIKNICTLLHLKKEEPTESRDEALRALLLETQKELAACRRNLMFANSDALTDMYIYAIKSHEIRYAHLLKMAKEQEAV